MDLISLLRAAIGKGTQAEFAAKAGVAQTTVSWWMRGDSLPPRTRIPALASVLGIPADKLAALVARERKARVRRVHAAKRKATAAPGAGR